MVSSRHIDLLSFPDLALRRIVRSFDHNSFFNFSICSKSAHQIAKSVWNFQGIYCFSAYYRIGEFKIEVGYKDDSDLTISIYEDSIELKCVQYKGRRKTKKFTIGFSELKKIWKHWNDQHPVFVLTEYLQNVYNRPPRWRITNSSEMNVREVLSSIDSVDELCLSGKKISNEDLVYMFNNTKSKYLVLFQNEKDCMRLNVDLSKTNVKYFWAKSVNWLTLNHLLEWDFIELLVTMKTRVTNNNINKLLKEWMKGNKENMVRIEFGKGQTYDPNVVLKGLNAELKSEENVKIFNQSLIPNSRLNSPIKGGYEIQRNDGGVARIIFTQTAFKGYFWPSD